MSTDDERQARLAEIRRRHRAVEENVAWAGICVTCDEAEPCDAMTLLSELDAATARAEAVVTGILSDICDMDQDDPDHDDSIIINVHALQIVLERWVVHGGIEPALAAAPEARGDGE